MAPKVDFNHPSLRFVHFLLFSASAHSKYQHCHIKSSPARLIFLFSIHSKHISSIVWASLRTEIVWHFEAESWHCCDKCEYYISKGFAKSMSYYVLIFNETINLAWATDLRCTIRMLFLSLLFHCSLYGNIFMLKACFSIFFGGLIGWIIIDRFVLRFDVK